MRVNPAMQMLIVPMLAIPFGAVLTLWSSTSHAAAWSGWARCVVDIRGPGYESNETHTWFVNGATTTAVPGTWSVAGKGKLSKDDGTTRWQAEWAINGQAVGDFLVTVASNQVSIKPLHSQLRQSGGITGYSQQTVSGSARSPVAISATAWEWQFPRIEGPATTQSLNGSSVTNPVLGWGWNQVSGSHITTSCTWSFLDGATPPPPPAVPPEGIPQPPPPPAATPPVKLSALAQLLKVDPGAVDRGANGVQVHLIAQGTHWRAGLTKADFGPDIAVVALTVNSPVDAVAVVNVSPVAALGPRAVQLSTPTRRATQEVVGLPNALNVYAVLQPAGSGMRDRLGAPK